MPLNELIQSVLNGYEMARNQPLANHELAQLIRSDIPEELSTLIQAGRYKVEGSAGQG
jgi:5-methylcytosine-specific restriction enzyme MrcB-like protein